MLKSDLPASFLLRGKSMPRRQSGDGPSTKESHPIAPQGLPVPRPKTPPPPRPYMVKGRTVELHPDAEVLDFGPGEKYANKDGTMRKLPPEQDTKVTPWAVPDYRNNLPKILEPDPGVMRRARGRVVPVAGSNEAAGRTHVCPQPGCGKAFKKRAHLRRHIEGLHRPISEHSSVASPLFQWNHL